MSFDIAIVGGGIVGCTIARQLSKYDLKVALLEKGHDVSLGATKANSGMIHGGYNAHRGSRKQFFNIRGNHLYQRLDDELNFGIDWAGSYVIAFNEEQERTLLNLQDNGQQGGLHTQIYAREETLERNPSLNPDLKRSLYCKHSAIVAPYEVCVAFAENAIKNGVEFFFNHEVNGIEREGENFRLLTSQKEIEAKIVINAAGLYSDTIAEMVGANHFKIIPRRGSYLLFRKGTSRVVSGFIFSCPSSKGKGVTISPTYHGNLFIGPDTISSGNKEDRGTELDSLAAIVKEASSLLPDLPMDKIIRTYSGVRASSTEKDFIVEESAVSGFINVAGIESPGLSAAPAIAEHVALLVKKTNRVKMVRRDDFDPYRPALTERKILENMKPHDEIKPLLNLPDDDENQVICRCEQVDRKTILNALRGDIPLRHLEGLKRRIRTGMGVCQGAYCESRLTKMVSQFYEIDKSEIYGYDWEQRDQNRVTPKEFQQYWRENE